MEKKFNNRKTYNMGKGDFLVVHEGLQNHPDIIVSINKIIADLQETLTSDRHLADSGALLRFRSKDLEDISKKCFERHKAEKELTLEQFNSLYPLNS